MVGEGVGETFLMVDFVEGGKSRGKGFIDDSMGRHTNASIFFPFLFHFTFSFFQTFFMIFVALFVS